MSTTATSASPLSPKMWLTTNSVRNTTLSLPDDSVYYEIVTRYWEPSITKVNRLIVSNDDRQKVLVAQIREPVSKRIIRLGRYGAPENTPSLTVDEKVQMEACEGTTKVRFRDTWVDAEQLVKFDDRM
jgi:hypothetical protein